MSEENTAPVPTHPHAELLRAIANGQEMQLCQPKPPLRDVWTNCKPLTALKIIAGDDRYDGFLVRIKPVDAFVTLYTTVERKTLNRVEITGFLEVKLDDHNLVLTFQGSELIDASVL